MKYKAGQIWERVAPFILEDREIYEPDEDGWMTQKIKSWRPGLRHELVYPDDAKPVWDGEGAEVRTIVAVAEILGGGTRILYRRQWRRPDGVTFGKTTVRITTPSAFTSWKNRDQDWLAWKELEAA